jgi:RNA polymerase sigma-70 factor (ECF subfamily)
MLRAMLEPAPSPGTRPLDEVKPKRAEVAPSPPLRSKTESEDLELCRKTAGGDESAFEALLIRYQDRVFSFCLRFLGDRAEAEDVAQDVFLTLYRSAGEFRGESAFSTWLLRIAKNQSLNRIKYLDRRGRAGRRSIDEVSEDRLRQSLEAIEPPSPDAVIEGGQTAAMVQGAIAALDAQHRAVVVLRDVEDLSYEEISGITGLPIGTVKSRIHRGRSALAEKLVRIFR